MIDKLLDFLSASPTAFNATETMKTILKDNGYQEIKEQGPFSLKKGGKYFLSRNNSSLIALNIGKQLKNASMHICASHSDCPSFKIKPNAIVKSPDGLQLNVETYGGPIYYTWLDRPLGIAGRVLIKENNKVVSRIFDSKKPVCIIPSVAIHMNRDANNGFKFNPQVDLLPLISLDENYSFEGYLANDLQVEKEQVLSFDLYLYPYGKGLRWGEEGELISSHHLDNLECAFTTLMGFLNNFNKDNINIYACFDNEETGSLSRQGADSDFLENTLKKTAASLNLDYYDLLSSTMMLSCDNAHAQHPNHPEKADPTNKPLINKGIVVKYNANQSYTSDGLSFALFSELMKKKKVPYQVFTNRSDLRGGGTLGNISNSHVSCISLDIGLGQLAMHSAFETAGSEDVISMINGIKAFYSAHLTVEGDSYSL